MLRLSFSPAANGKKLDMGGEGKDKFMMIGLVVVIIGAIGFLAWSLMPKGSSSGGRSEDVLLKCLKCGHQEEMDRDDVAKAYREIPADQRRAMAGVRLPCPQCQDPEITMVQGMECPKCNKKFVSWKVEEPARRRLGLEIDEPHRRSDPVICPHCGVDVDEYWRANKGLK